LRQLDLTQLRTFTTIVDCNSLSLAAQRLYKTQSAVSIQLKKLEEQVGSTLIKRGYNCVELTAEGEVLLQYAQKLLLLSDNALNALNPADSNDTVRLGIPDDYAGAYLLPTMRTFAQRFPQVKLQICSDISQNLFAKLDQGELDLALVTLRKDVHKGEILRRDQLFWVADKSFDFNHTRPLPLALYPQGCEFRKHVLDNLSQAGKDYYIAFECTGVTGVKVAVDSGLAITTTSHPLMQPNWQILDAQAHQLPSPGAVVIELRTGNTTLTAAQEYFVQELRRQVLAL